MTFKWNIEQGIGSTKAFWDTDAAPPSDQFAMRSNKDVLSCIGAYPGSRVISALSAVVLELCELAEASTPQQLIVGSLEADAAPNSPKVCRCGDENCAEFNRPDLLAAEAARSINESEAALSVFLKTMDKQKAPTVEQIKKILTDALANKRYLMDSDQRLHSIPKVALPRALISVLIEFFARVIVDAWPLIIGAL